MDEDILIYLTSLDLFDDNESRMRKELCISKLRNMSRKWVISLSAERGFKHLESTEQLPCLISLQGSAYLGVGFKHGDVDVVLVTPNFIGRDDFFSSFFKYIQTDAAVSELIAVPDTIVPLIRLKLDGVMIDIVMSQLSLDRVPYSLTFEQSPYELYRTLDSPSILGLSGIHLAQVLDTIPNQVMFRCLVKCVKTWVYRRSLSDYVYGFPASTAWVIMCAFLCNNMFSETGQSRRLAIPTNLLIHEDQLSLLTLLKIFFGYFANWQWPCPVTLSPIVTVPQLSVHSWNVKRNAHDLMPIITPVFPHKNAAFTVRPSTKTIVVHELKRAQSIMEQNLQGIASWDKLFEVYNVRDHYRHFARLHLKADNDEELARLGGLIDSRLRDLAQLLESNVAISSVRISKSLTSDTSEALTRTWLLGMEFISITQAAPTTKQSRTIDITTHLSKFYQILRERDAVTNFVDKLTATYIKRSQLIDP